MNEYDYLKTNTGYWLKKPFESNYNVVRRFVITNPGRPLSMYLAEIKKKQKERSRGILGLLEAIKFEEEYKGYSSDSSNHTDFKPGYSRPLQHCPQCATRCFHTELFYEQSLNFCPIHKCKLIEICPKCALPWPSVPELFGRECEVCGNSLSLTQVGKAFGTYNRAQYIEIHNILDLFKTLRCGHSVQLWNEWFVSFDAQLMEKKEKLGFFFEIHARRLNLSATTLLYTQPLKSKILNYRTLKKFNDDFVISRTTLWHFKAKLRAIKIISRILQKQMPNKHSLEFLDYQVDNYVTRYHILGSCPFCLSFSIWFDVITKFSTYRTFCDRFKKIFDPLNVYRNVDYQQPAMIYISRELMDKDSIDLNQNKSFAILSKVDKQWLALRLMILEFIKIYNAIALYRSISNYSYEKNCSFHTASEKLKPIHSKVYDKIKYQYHVNKNQINLVWALPHQTMLEMPQRVYELKDPYIHENLKQSKRLDLILEPIINESYLKPYLSLVKHRAALIKNFGSTHLISLMFNCSLDSYIKKLPKSPFFWEPYKKVPPLVIKRMTTKQLKAFFSRYSF
jgi:hypothetical protein